MIRRPLASVSVGATGTMPPQQSIRTARVAAAAFFSLLLLGSAAQAVPFPKVLDNDHLRFGDGGGNSVNADGTLQQPFYCQGSAPCPQWLRLTYSNYPLDTAIGIDGDGSGSDVNPWNNNGTIVTVSASQGTPLTGQVLDYAGFLANGNTKGSGTVV